MGDAGGAPDFSEAGRKLFAGECRFIWAAARADNLPPTGPPEIAFAGRSNVGKSSLLNALTGRNSLARTSNTPGRTQELNFFAFGGAQDGDAERLRLVDMPGYGYAAVSKEKIAGWTRLMHDFLRGRATLARVFVLVDARHGLKALDREMLGILDTAAVSYQVVLTKIDELKPPKLAEIETAVLAELRRCVAAHPEIFATSAEAGSGIEALRGGIARLLAELQGATNREAAKAKVNGGQPKSSSTAYLR